MLYPIDLESEELTLALEQLTIRIEHLFHISCPFKYDKVIAVEDSKVAANIYRIAQEAITNPLRIECLSENHQNRARFVYLYPYQDENHKYSLMLCVLAEETEFFNRLK